MAKKPQPHRYADRLSFERILLLIATLIHHPGVGSREEETNEVRKMNDEQNTAKNSSFIIPPSSFKCSHHNALEPLQTKVRQFAQSLDIPFPDNYPSIGTLRKDLETLRDYGILDRRMYRWGYYLGTGAMSREELKVAFNALQSQAQYQGDPQIRKIYHTLEKRLRGLELDGNANFSYPVRAYLNRPIIHTDPEEMQAKGNNRHTLFHCLDTLEEAIATGQLVELYRFKEPYQNRIGYLNVYPLQLFYHDIAWYLLYEEASTPDLYEPDEIQHLEVERLDRLKDHCRIIQPQGRGQNTQLESLKLAQNLMKMGWGIYLGTPENQHKERKNRVSFEWIIVHFFPPSTHFILEGECRHLNQTVKEKTDKHGNYYIEYRIKLPRRSFPEFCRWVYRHLDKAQFTSPPDLVEKHKQALQLAVNRYK